MLIYYRAVFRLNAQFDSMNFILLDLCDLLTAAKTIRKPCLILLMLTQYHRKIKQVTTC